LGIGFIAARFEVAHPERMKAVEEMSSRDVRIMG